MTNNYFAHTVQHDLPDLSDIKMPKLDGVNMALRLAEATYGIPVILMNAGHDDWAGVVRALLRKPFIQDLLSILAVVAVVMNEREHGHALPEDAPPHGRD